MTASLKAARPAIVVICILAALLLSACAVSTPVPTATREPIPVEEPTSGAASTPAPQTLNLVRDARLASATEVDILELDSSSGAGGAATYSPKVAITDEATITRLVAALDEELDFTSSPRCLARYVLVFRLADGTEHEYGYTCGPGGPLFLRGDAEYFGGQAVLPPMRFDDLIVEQLTAGAPLKGLNVVAVADLDKTEAIEILKLDPLSADTSARAYTLKLDLTDREIIGKLVDALDREIELGPRIKIPAQFTLVFHLEGGSEEQYGYVDDGSEFAGLRGDEAYFGDQDARAPEEFRRLMTDLLASPEPVTERQAVGWYGQIKSLASGSQYDDYLELCPKEVGAVGIAGADESIEAQIQALRDTEKYAHFWGRLTCGVPDYGTCQLMVSKLRADAPGPFFPPDPIQPWEGTIVSLPEGARSGGDDCFVLDGEFPIRYGIDSQNPATAAQLKGLRDSGTVIRISGLLNCGVPDCCGSQIQVQDLQVLGSPEAADGWTGRLVALPPGSQQSHYFERDDGERYGIQLTAELTEAMWTGADVKVWGRLLHDVPAYNSMLIQVERVEIVSGPSAEARNLSPFAEATASSSLASDRGGTYQPFSVLDGSLSTCWSEDARGDGIGEWVMLVFPDSITVERVAVSVGYDRDEHDKLHAPEVFYDNNRLKKATVGFSGGEEVSLEFSDARGLQMRDVAPVTTTFVRIVIDEAYPGVKYDDTCLAEIQVWGTTD